MKQQKRNTRTYKTTDSVYKKAMRRAKREKGKLSTMLESVVIGYAHGFDIKLITDDSKIQ